MRISTTMQFNTGTRNILSQQYELQRTQTQLSSGRKMLAPSDDPMAARAALQVEQAKGLNSQFMTNQSAARSALSSLEGTLASLGDQMSAIKTALIAAGNGTYDASQRSMIAEDLQLRLNAVLDLANTQDAEGNYIFAGYQSNQRPFEFDSASNQFVFRGDQGQLSLQVAPSINMVVQENGEALFMRLRDAQGNLNPGNVFQSIHDAIDTLRSPTFDVSNLSTHLGNVDAAMNNMLQARGGVGVRLNGLDNLEDFSRGMDVLNQSRLSELQDLNYAEAISRFARFQTQLEASQITFKQVTQMSLFKLI